jgi:hypothetical protein
MENLLLPQPDRADLKRPDRVRRTCQRLNNEKPSTSTDLSTSVVFVKRDRITLWRSVVIDEVDEAGILESVNLLEELIIGFQIEISQFITFCLNKNPTPALLKNKK